MNTSSPRSRFGFTLVELMVVVSVIGILTAIVYANFGDSRKIARDDIRKTDLKDLQVAIQLYKAQNGSYPLGCNGSGQWSSGSPGNYACATAGANYIVGLTPDFMATLPIDPLQPTTGNAGIIYKSDGTNYKLMANQTVEKVLIANFTDTFARCPDSSGGGSCSSVPTKTYAVYSAGASTW